MKKIGFIASVAALTIGLSATASAAFINGSLSFSDGYDSLGNIVSTETVMNVQNISTATGGTGDFAGLSGNTVSSDIDLNNPAGVIYRIGGFTFTLSSVANVATTPLACLGGLCGDEISFNLVGTVTGPGALEETSFLGNWTGNGTCLQDGDGNTCTAGTASGSWSSSIVATGAAVPVPEPGTLALLGLGMIGFVVSRRRV